MEQKGDERGVIIMRSVRAVADKTDDGDAAGISGRQYRCFNKDMAAETFFHSVCRPYVVIWRYINKLN